MAVSLRMTRMGSKKRPFYRIVAVDSKTRRDGRYIEVIGTFNPLNEEVKINKEPALKWLKVGAKPSDTVRKLLSSEGVMKEFHDSKANAKPKPKAKAKPKASAKTKVSVKPKASVKTNAKPKAK